MVRKTSTFLSLILVVIVLYPMCLEAAAKPDVIPRSAWGAVATSCISPHTITHAIIHHGASSSNGLSNHDPDCYNTVWAYYDWHTSPAGNGWCDIGYQFLVCPHGFIFGGRDGDPDNTADGGHRGAHVGGCNTGLLGVCAVGNYESPDPNPVTESMTTHLVNASARIIAWKFDQAGLTALETSTASCGQTLERISYHRHIKSLLGGSTACPGRVLIPQEPPSSQDPIGRIRQRVCEILGQCDPDVAQLQEAVMAPNPTSDGTLNLYIKASLSNVALRAKIFTLSGRKIRQWDGLYDGMDTYMKISLGSMDSQGNLLANGTYRYLVEILDGTQVLDRKKGTFFVLR